MNIGFRANTGSRLVGDIIVSAERGQYMAYTTVTTIFGPSVSPIFGGALS